MNAVGDADELSKLKIKYWAEGLDNNTVGYHKRDDLRRIYTRLYQDSNYDKLSAFQEMFEVGIFDPSGFNYYKELMEELERTKGFILDLANFDNAIASNKELDTYLDLNESNTRPSPERQLDEVWIPQGLVNASERSVFVDLINRTGSISKTQAYFVDIYDTLTDKTEISHYRDALVAGASAHTLSELHEFRLSQGLSLLQTQELMDLLEDPKSTANAPGGVVDPQRARKYDLLRESLAFDALPVIGTTNYTTLSYSSLMNLLNRVQTDGSVI